MMVKLFIFIHIFNKYIDFLHITIIKLLNFLLITILKLLNFLLLTILKLLNIGRELFKRWGFKRCEDIVWAKTNKESTDRKPPIKNGQIL